MQSTVAGGAYALVTSWMAYAFHRYLFAVNILSCTAIMSLGDVALQTVEQYGELSQGYNWKRTGK